MLRTIQVWALVLVSCLLSMACGNGEEEPRIEQQVENACPTFFVGKVIDQVGKPIPDAVIVVETTPLVPGFQAGETVADRQAGKSWEVHSDTKGLFGVMIPGGHQVLEIRNIKKDGYGWVRDWMWPPTLPRLATDANNYFTVGGRMPVEIQYTPDPDRPAIFPLHLNDAPGPVGKPSRGGSNRDPAGNVSVNNPVDVWLPTSGPDAPEKDPKTLEQAIARMAAQIGRSGFPPP